MKKILFLLAMLPMMVFTACSSGSDEDDLKFDYKDKITGVWESGNVLVSFSGDGYYSAILDETFMDCGSYSIVDNNIYCTNTYLNKNTTYKINNVNTGGIELSVNYTNFKGEDEKTALILNKSSRNPSSKDNVLTGKKYFFMKEGYGVCFVQFNTYNTARMQTDELNPNVQSWNYFYIEPYIYTQKYKDDNHGISLFYKDCGKGEVFKYKVVIGNNGEIEDIEM